MKSMGKAVLLSHAKHKHLLALALKRAQPSMVDFLSACTKEPTVFGGASFKERRKSESRKASVVLGRG